MEDRDFTQLTPSAPQVVPSQADARADEYFRRPRLALCVGVGLLALFVLFAFLVPPQPLAIDRAWSELMSDLHSPVLKGVALVFNYLGRGLLRALTLTAVGVVLIFARRIVALVAYGVAEGLAPLISSVTKALVDRPRPPHELLHASGASFPSGHASYAGVTCVALVLLFTKRAPRSWSLAIAVIVAMAWSRTYLQVHWLSDVCAGSILGVAVALIAFGAVALPLPFSRK